MTKDDIKKLQQLESAVLEHFENEKTAKIERFFVKLSSTEKMWTWKIEVESEERKSLPPIVLVHGMG